MGRTPAVIIVVRHGARLDAADKTWHLSSPTPYDPPLTYGGWTQSKALGARIAGLLHARALFLQEDSHSNPTRSRRTSAGRKEIEDIQLGSSPETRHRRRSSRTNRRKHKVMIHSSPYLRAMQTSIAISAGIAEYQGNAGSRSRSKSPHVASHYQSHSGRAHDVHPRSPGLAAIPEPMDDFRSRVLQRHHSRVGRFVKPVLRLDAFLGEWLSPDYFESITPPPNSTMMLASAKAELMRKGEAIEIVPSLNVKGFFPGGWGASSNNKDAAAVEEGNFSFSALSSSLPRRDRASSHSSASSSKSSGRPQVTTSSLSKESNYIYSPPVPNYAVSTSDPIPAGYVAHARDACINVDLHWDSSREPQDWGDGGEFGEEWSALHKRFRRGIYAMVDWYKEHGVGNKPDDASLSPETAANREEVDEEENDEDTDTVLVLVTHGAGCNALIGALTNQPVLLDVGMASLTMAVRKDQPATPNPSSPIPGSPSPLSRVSSGVTLADMYDMRLIASTEHLRQGVDPFKMPAFSQGKHNSQQPAEYRRRYGSQSGLNEAWSVGDSSRTGPASVNAALGSIRRSSVQAPMPLQTYDIKPYDPAAASPGSSPAVQPTGLWNPTSPRQEEPKTAGIARTWTVDQMKTAGRGMTINTSVNASQAVATSNGSKPVNGEPKPSEATMTSGEKENEEQPGPLPNNLGRTLSQHGLWGSRPSGSNPEKAGGSKRRWTVSDRDA